VKTYLRNLAVLIAAVAILVGCEGDTGAEGAQGSAGPPGPPGPPGPGGGGTALEVSTAQAITAEITGVTVDSDTRATVSFNLRNELGQPLKALPAANIRFTIAQLQPGVGGAGSTWHAYVTRLDESTLQANAETATTDGAVFTDNGDGTYTYTFAKPLDGYAPDGVTYDGTLTHRIGLELRSNDALAVAAANNAPFDFLPSTGATTDLPLTRYIVDNDTCFACHDRLEFHGGPRTDVAYCVTCHNPSTTDGQAPHNTLEFVVLIHKIHMGEELANSFQITGFGGEVFEAKEVVFPQDQRNCQTCHEEDDADTPQASNWRLMPYAKACGACHDDVNFQTGENHSTENIVATDDQCVTCHGADSTIDNGNLRVAVVHQIPEKLAGEKFQYNLLGVTNTAPGQAPVVRFSVTDPTNDDAPYNILTDAPFVAGGASSLSIDIGWSTSDYTNEDSQSASGVTGTPAQPIRINPLSSGGTPATGPDAEGAFTSTSPIPLPAAVEGSIAVALEGHPGVNVEGDDEPESIAVTSAVDYFAATGDVEPRRDIVNVQKCDDCHNQLSVHGSNRTDNVQVCAVCHNPNATDINRRVDGSECVTELGPDDSPTDFKYMIHAIHAGERANFTVCGFGNRPHSFAELGYPGQLNNCEGCHITPDADETASYYPVDTSSVLATTVDAGAERGSPIDDVAWSPNTAVCSACHTSTVAEAHMLQNGGSKTLTKNADGTTAGGPLETCQLCHGPGRTADVKVLHGVDRFEFQAPAADP
jgi:OmcA/MtrC family decaheme c-type cytochrome